MVEDEITEFWASFFSSFKNSSMSYLTFAI